MSATADRYEQFRGLGVSADDAWSLARRDSNNLKQLMEDYERQQRIRSLKSRLLEKQRHMTAVETAVSRAERHASPPIYLEKGMRVSAHPSSEPRMIVEYTPPPRRKRRHSHDLLYGVSVSMIAAGIGMSGLGAGLIMLPLWCFAALAVLAAVVGYLALMTRQVLKETIPASQRNQRMIDWITDKELPPLPERYTCLDCGRFPEECECGAPHREPERLVRPGFKFDSPCPGAVQQLGQTHDRCVLCNFPIDDH